MPTTVTVERLTAKHSEWTKASDRWALLRKMVEGGSEMDKEARLKLLYRPDGAKKTSILDERAKMSVYTAKISVPITRTVAQLFQKDAKVTGKGSDSPEWQKFIDEGAVLYGDDDRRTSLLNLYRTGCRDLLTVGKMIVKVDTRIGNASQLSLEEQKVKGLTEVYASLVPRENLWDWLSDDKGFVYCKLYEYSEKRPTWQSDLDKRHEFLVYSRNEDSSIVWSRYRVKPKHEKDKDSFDIHQATSENAVVEVVVDADGRELENVPLFSFNGKYIFPIFTICVDKSFWVADQLFDLATLLFNLYSGISFNSVRNLFQMPVFIRGDNVRPGTDPSSSNDDFFGGQLFGNGYCLVLPKGSQVTSLQSTGVYITIAMSIIEKVISIDFLEVLQQMVLSATNSPSILGRSAESKQQDSKPESLLMELFGELFRNLVKQIFQCAAIVKGEDIEWNVEGFDEFMTDGLLEYLAGVTQVGTLKIPSGTFNKAILQATVKRIGKVFNLDDSIITKALAEVEKADIQLMPLAENPIPPTPPLPETPQPQPKE